MITVGASKLVPALLLQAGPLCRTASVVLCHLHPLSTCAEPVVAAAACKLAPAASDQSKHRSWWWAAAALGAAVTAAGAPVALADSSKQPVSSSSSIAQAEEGDGVSAGGKLLSLSMRQRIFFKYEKRIRDLSTLEKIYEYFATNSSSDGRKVMGAKDVVRALVPTYPPVGSTVERAGFLDGERGHSQSENATKAIISFFDHNKDGVIGFDEFVLIVIALSVPENDVEVVFDVIDLDNNGVLDEAEFMQVLQQLERRAGLQHKHVGRVGKNAVESNDRQMTHTLFEHQAGKGVSLDRFRKFLTRLQDGMLKLEFAHYDWQSKGFMQGADFANSLVTAADIKMVDKYLDKVQQLQPKLAGAKITFKQFEQMAQLRRHLYMLSFALDFCAQIERPLAKADFCKVLYKTLKVQLAPIVVDILFAVFGDEQGLFDGPAFVATMKSRNRVPGYRRGQGLGVEESETVGPLLGWWNCVRNCSFTGQDSSHTPH